MKNKLIDYRLSGHGWATVNIYTNESPITRLASYLHDSLGQLSTMALNLHNNSTKEQVVFMDEPGEIWLVVQGDGNQLRYEVREYADWASWGMQGVGTFKSIAQGQHERSAFIRNVYHLLDDIYVNTGLSEYKSQWVQHDFPENQYLKLNSLYRKGLLK